MTGPLISACVTFSKFLNITASFAVVGTLLAMAFLLLDSEGKLSTSGEKLRLLLQLSSIFWVIGNIGTIFFTLANIFGSISYFSSRPYRHALISHSSNAGSIFLLSDRNFCNCTFVGKKDPKNQHNYFIADTYNYWNYRSNISKPFGI